MASLQERLARARDLLVRAGIDPAEAALDADLLARDVLGWDRAALLTRQRDPVPSGLDPEFDGRIARRSRREPVAYIRGHQEFWGLDFEVTPDVLIPRPETEIVVEEAIREAQSMACPAIVDVGTGSGCIAIAIAAALPTATVVATDVSTAALDVARRNATRHGVADRVTFVTGDLLQGIAGPADAIVSNPPYVPRGDVLPPEVARYEPPTALYAGDDGLSVVRRLLTSAAGVLATRGVVIVEFGFGQEADVRALARAGGWTIDIRHDLQSIPRVALLRR
jgi:release factor glutamine methyltransferase